MTERTAEDYERSIKEKVWEANILTAGEWVYLVGLFLAAKEGVALTGFFNSLTPEQQKAALEYRGPENHGSMDGIGD